MTQAVQLVPVDAKTADWPRKVATVLNRLQNTTAAAGGTAAWGGITGTLSAQTDLQTALNAKQATLVSGTNIKTVNSTTLLGSGNLAVGTVTSVAATVPTGFSIAGSPITSSGTLAITFAAGYSLPTDASQANWNTAFSWGNHATAGYLTTAAAAAAYQPLDTQLTSLAGLSYTGNSLKVVRVNAGETAFELATLSGGSLSDADYGDITVSGGGTVMTIDAGTVTLAKMANMATDSILGRATAGTGAPEVLTALPFAYTGDVTRPADSNAQTIANDAVTYAKMQNVSAASKLLGRGSAGGSGDVEEIGLGVGLAMSSTTLSAGAWVLAGTGQTATGVYDFAVDGAKANIDFAGLGDYNELLVIARDLTDGTTGQRSLRVSVDGGSTFYSASGDYISVSKAGAASNTISFALHDTNSTAARTLVAQVRNMKGAVKYCLSNHTPGDILFVASTSDINAIRITNSGGGNITGGTVRVFAR